MALAFLVFMPFAIGLSQIGRRWSRWFEAHWKIQAFVVFPLVVSISPSTERPNF